MLRALFAAALSVTASPALADAVVYSGTLGKAPIVLELTGDPKTETLPPAGRYFYASKGVDIPLTGLITVGGKLRMIELGVCTEATCTVDGNGKVTKAPPGGEWTLSFAADGQTLAGTWTGADKKKSFPIALTKIGIRELPTDSAVSPTALYAIVTELAMGDMPITEQT